MTDRATTATTAATDTDLSVEDNSHAGQGSVMLDIGGDIGALIVTMPSELTGVEVEIRPVGAAPAVSHEHEHEHEHEHDHAHNHDHAHDHPHFPHVAVVGRPIGGRIVPSLVYGELLEGSYELYVRPAGAVQLTVDVRGGCVTESTWPTLNIA